MNQSFFPASARYRALTLTERISFSTLNKLNHKFFHQKIDTELARRKIERWRSQPPFSEEELWLQRLAMDDLTEEKLFNLLGQPTEATGSDLSSSLLWAAEIEQTYTQSATSNVKKHISLELLQQEANGFLYAVEPLIERGYQQLEQKIKSLSQKQSQLPFDSDTVIEMLGIHLPEQLLWMLNRTMILELNVARLQGQLSGDTPESRFQSFLEQLKQPERALALFTEYPVLLRQVQISIDRWVRFSSEFLQHLCADWDEIQATFSPEQELGILSALQWNAGDSHRGGRSVLIAKFSSGSQLVYKPRSLAVDIHFQELLLWLNQRGNHPPFRTLKVLNRGSRGWVEFVKSCECNTEAEVKRFYERQGGYLALLYALQATDFHAENLIAAGEDPVLIDLESLFHPRLASDKLQGSDLLVNDRLAYSVLSVGLLPQRIWIDAESESIDLSGLGTLEGKLTPYQIPYWQGIGTDEMHLKRKQVEMSGSQNRPRLNGKEIDALAYADFLEIGFINLYQLLWKYRAELLTKNGPIASFAQDEVRVIIRDTHVYGSLLHESFHPDVLRDALDRNRLFDRLWLDIKERPYLARVIAAEGDDLWQGDIPVFTTQPNLRAIWSSSGEQIDDFYDESCLTLVQRRLSKLDEADLKQQIWFIHASFCTLISVADHKRSSYSLSEPKKTLGYQKLLQSAREVGDRLETLALSSQQNTSWIGLNLVDEKHWILAPSDIDLYEGLPGIILFLAYLGQITQEKRYTNLAKAAFKTLQGHIESCQEYLTSIGGFCGWGGIIYTLTQLGTIWNDPQLLSQAETIADFIAPLIEQDEQFDLIGGSAGCIASLISLYRCRPHQSILDVAIQCGDRLLDTAQSMESGIGWVLKNGGAQPLAGFSHGAAGIAWALLELAAVTGEKRFYQAAVDAINYERSLFCSTAGNWLDLRKFTQTVVGEKETHSNCMTAWCHGAPGIGLARLNSLPHLDNPEIRAEINTALKTTLKEGFGHNHSLCHGDLGNLELLLQASLILEDLGWKSQVNRLAAIVLESIEQHGWLCGVPLAVETPGLMTGLAGIGYQLLRLAQPENVPAVLTLEPPKLNAQMLSKVESALVT